MSIHPRRGTRLQRLIFISVAFLLALQFFYAAYILWDNTRTKIAESRLQFSLQSEQVKSRVDQMFSSLMKNTERLRDFTMLTIQLGPKRFMDEALSVSKPLIDDSTAQFDVYWAFEEPFARKFFGTRAYLAICMKNPSLANHPSFNDPRTFILDTYTDQTYQIDPKERWYHQSKANRDVNFTPLYYDSTYMKMVMFSATTGLFDENGKFFGVVGIDVTTDSFMAATDPIRVGVTGGILIVDEQGMPLAPFLGRDQPIIGYLHNAAVPRTRESFDPHIAGARPISVAPGIQEYVGNDGDAYLTFATKLDLRPWYVVAFQKKYEAYFDIYSHLSTVLLTGLLILAFILFVGYQLTTFLAQSIQNLLSNLDENEKLIGEVEQAVRSFQLLPMEGPEEFQQLAAQMNQLYLALERSFRDLKDAKTSAERATAAKSRFLSVMSHEIRTPLNSMLGMTDVLLQTPLTPDQQKYLGVLQRSGQTLLRILNDILDFSKLEAGKIQLENQSFWIFEVLAGVDQLMRFHAESRGLSFRVTAPDLDYFVEGDSLRIRQVLLNLVGNAVKFTQKGGIEIRVSTANDPSSDRQKFVFEIRDTGIGIPPEQLDQIFKEFSQADSSIQRRFGGSGLGLSITRQLLDLMGSRIRVNSEVGRGTVFYFSLDLLVRKREQRKYESAAILDPAPAPLSAETLRALPGAHGTVTALPGLLVVDDDEDNHHLLDAYLKSCSALRAEHCYRGAEAIEKFEKRRYGLVLLDMQMPEMDGITVLKRMREIEAKLGREPSPIVILSANAFDEDRQHSMANGATDHLTKPLKLDLFLRTVETYFGEGRPAKSAFVQASKS